ncbi:MAG: GGDEF domain-containing protein [Pseudomonadota bacterium]
MLKHFLPKFVNPVVRVEQIRLLYQQGLPIQILGILTAILSVIIFWKVADHVMLGLWLGIHVVVTLIRLAVTVKFTSSKITEYRALEKWAQAYVAGTFISGLIWGSLSLFFSPAWPAAYQVTLFTVYTGIIAGALNTNSSLFVAFLAFYLPPVGCLIYVILRQPTEAGVVLAALFLIYAILMYVSALKFHNRLAMSLGVSFENERLAEQLAQSNQKLMRLVDMDELTGIANRRSMDKCLSSEWNRLLRAKKPLSLLFIDLDFFKQYNDTYGHDGGDQCLIQVAKILRIHSQRSSDMVARFGGEEFAVILPETSEGDALKIAARILADLESLNIPHTGSKVAKRVTLSIGVASMIPNQPDNDDFLRLSADKALYQAKEMGRNQIVKANFDGELK